MRDLARTHLVVIQGTPFCNLDCGYCYLPDRTRTERISDATLETIISRLHEWNHFERKLTVLWHAGEPLVLGASFYRVAFDKCNRLASPTLAIQHAVQTNATLVTSEHCKLFSEYKVGVGVSLDGPEQFHDSFRRHRSGRGTFLETVRGLRKFQDYGLNPSVIAVLSSQAMQNPDTFFDFFVDLGVPLVGLNVQEREASSVLTILNDQLATPELYRSFLTRVFSRSLAENGPLFREFVSILNIIEHGTPLSSNSESNPAAILSFSCTGRFGTFSPEFAETVTETHGQFAMGDVHSTSIASALSMIANGRIGQDIEHGLAACASSCPYFTVCGGGSPSNKLGETQRLDSTQTVHCRFSKQVVVDVVVELLQKADLRAKALSQLEQWRRFSH